ETVLVHHRTIHHGGVHADQAVVANRAGVHHRGVADGDALADQAGKARAVRTRVGDVHDAAVLDAAACTDADMVDIPAQHRAGPDRHVVAQHHVADHAGGGVDVDALAEAGGNAL